MDVWNIRDVPAFTTKDGSEIRELLNAGNSAIRNQSLAEARLPPGGQTTRHLHPRTEEIYYVLEGTARMEIAGVVREIGPGDAVAIPPGLPHQIITLGEKSLVFLCCCAPGYQHDDTVFAPVK